MSLPIDPRVSGHFWAARQFQIFDHWQWPKQHGNNKGRRHCNLQHAVSTAIPKYSKKTYHLNERIQRCCRRCNGFCVGATTKRLSACCNTSYFADDGCWENRPWHCTACYKFSFAVSELHNGSEHLIGTQRRWRQIVFYTQQSFVLWKTIRRWDSLIYIG